MATQTPICGISVAPNVSQDHPAGRVKDNVGVTLVAFWGHLQASSVNLGHPMGIHKATMFKHTKNKMTSLPSETQIIRLDMCWTRLVITLERLRVVLEPQKGYIKQTICKVYQEQHGKSRRCNPKDTFGYVLEASWCHLGASWGRLGSSRGRHKTDKF